MNKKLNIEAVIDRAYEPDLPTEEAVELISTGVVYAAITLVAKRKEPEVLLSAYNRHPSSATILIHLINNQATPEEVFLRMGEKFGTLSPTLIHAMLDRLDLAASTLKKFASNRKITQEIASRVLRHPNCDDGVVEAIVATWKDNSYTPQRVRVFDMSVRMKQVRALIKQSQLYSDWPEEWIEERFSL